MFKIPTSRDICFVCEQELEKEINRHLCEEQLKILKEPQGELRDESNWSGDEPMMKLWWPPSHMEVAEYEQKKAKLLRGEPLTKEELGVNDNYDY